jgi:hypothetical protein
MVTKRIDIGKKAKTNESDKTTFSAISTGKKQKRDSVYPWHKKEFGLVLYKTE